MNIFDLIVGVLAIYMVYKGAKRGLVLEVTSLLALVLGLFLSYYFYASVAQNYLVNYVDWSPQTLNLSAFLLLFIGIALMVHLLGRLITKLLDIAALGLFNRVLGALFGLIKLALLLLVFNVTIDYVLSLLGMSKLPEFLDTSLVYNFSQEVYKFLMPQLFQLLA